MSRKFLILLLFSGALGFVLVEVAASQSPSATSRRPVSYYTARTAEQFQAPHVLTYHLLEFAQQRGPWIFPDLGAVDYGHGNYREIFLGAGAVYYHNKTVTLTQILYFAQDTGSAAKHARYLWPWPVVNLQFTPRLSSETVAYVCAPLNKGAYAQYVVDRIKLEYAFNRRFTLGAGYSASKNAHEAWKQKPFLTTTLNSRAGAFEFWLQRLPGGGQLQLRYLLTH